MISSEASVVVPWYITKTFCWNPLVVLWDQMSLGLNNMLGSFTSIGRKRCKSISSLLVWGYLDFFCEMLKETEVQL